VGRRIGKIDDINPGLSHLMIVFYRAAADSVDLSAVIIDNWYTAGKSN